MRSLKGLEKAVQRPARRSVAIPQDLSEDYPLRPPGFEVFEIDHVLDRVAVESGSTVPGSKAAENFLGIDEPTFTGRE